MGGFGSGRYQGGRRKVTAEESISFGLVAFRGRIYPRSSGSLAWTRAGKVTASVRYSVAWDPVPTLTLIYHRGETDVRIPIRLDTTYPALGGLRWWFTCPLIVDGVPCNRRVGKLFLPPQAKYFGCRHCHRLTYRSSQKAHEIERYLAWINSLPQKLER